MSIIPNFPQHLLDLHHNWHSPGSHPGGGSGRMIPPGSPGSGLEFLTFHRDFVVQFHSWYDTQPFADPNAVAAWTAMPTQLKDPMVTGWNASLANQETRIITNSPAFASADELGIFIENGIHNWIHGATATVFNEPVVATLHSPQSTFFYNIHGLVDYWWMRWQSSQKSLIKDVIDSKHHLKEQIKEFKEKDIIDTKNRLKEQIKEIKEKDIFEIPNLPGVPVDPMLQVSQLEQRLSLLESQVAANGQAFIRPQERPSVGEGTLHG